MSSCSETKHVRAVRLLLVLVLSLLTLGVFAPSAGAHAILDHSDPAAGSVLAGDPTVARLWFNEDISGSFSSARLVDAAGAPVPGTSPAPSDEPRTLALELPALSPGAYGILWQVLSEDDGHPTTGVVVFSVGTSGSAITPTVAIGAGSSAKPADVALRWIAFCLLAGVIGGIAVGGYVLPRAAKSDPDLGPNLRGARRRIVTLSLASAAGSLLIGVAILIQEARQLIPIGVEGSGLGSIARLVTSTRWGHLWFAREAVFILLTVVLASMARSGGPRDVRAPWRAMAVAGWLALAVVVIQALGSHAAALPSGRAMAIAADAVHLLTACLWIGALPTLVLILWPRSGSAAARGALARACRSPFSRLAATSVVLVIATGLYSAGRQVNTVGSLTGSSYGKTLLVKSALLVVVVGLGAMNAILLHGWRPAWFRAAGKTPRSRPSRSLVLAELAVGVVLLFAVGVLTASAPARSPSVVVSAPPTKTIGGVVKDLTVSIAVSPDQPGVNGFTVVAASSFRPAPAPIDAVALTLTRGGRTFVVRLEEVEPGRYFGTGSLPDSGDWAVTGVVSRAGETFNVAASLPVATSPATSASVPPPIGHPLAPWVDALALLTLAAGAGMALWRWAASRRGTSSNGARSFRDGGADPTEAPVTHVVSQPVAAGRPRR